MGFCPWLAAFLFVAGTPPHRISQHAHSSQHVLVIRRASSENFLGKLPRRAILPLRRISQTQNSNSSSLLCSVHRQWSKRMRLGCSILDIPKILSSILILLRQKMQPSPLSNTYQQHPSLALRHTLAAAPMAGHSTNHPHSLNVVDPLCAIDEPRLAADWQINGGKDSSRFPRADRLRSPLRRGLSGGAPVALLRSCSRAIPEYPQKTGISSVSPRPPDTYAMPDPVVC